MAVYMALALPAIAVALTTTPTAAATITMGPIEDVPSFGQLINAPNGHISFMRDHHVYDIWLPGRDPGLNQEGGFLLEVPDWSTASLAAASAVFGLGPADPHGCNGDDFDRNYAATNAVVRGPDPGVLLAFYDAEFHASCPGGEPEGQPLLSSIGLATSADGGVTWQKQGRVIEGLDEAHYGFAALTDWQLHHSNSDDGASGPSVVVRDDDHGRYLYLYYADRAPRHGEYADARPDSVYVARARFETNGMPGNWQKWTGTSWGAVGDQTAASPIVAPHPGDEVALQPHVSFNTALREWLMVFKTKSGFNIAVSRQGLAWSTPVSVFVKRDSEATFGFPTLVSVESDYCDGDRCADRRDSGQPGRDDVDVSQQVTGTTGYLYYTSRPVTSNAIYYGHRVSFRIDEPADVARHQ